ncbi:MAG: WD40/YVTN/BNR-like repeat-containing protein [Verrucomicrobium sp.]
MFVACGHQGQRIVSDDGINWKNFALGKDGEVYRAAAKGGGHYVCVGTLGGKNIMLSSPDGVTWASSTNDAKYSNYVQGIAHGNGAFLAVGGDAGSVGSAKPFVMTSPDGVKWSGFISIPGRFILRRITYGNGLWVGVGDRGRRACSKDGSHWEDVEKIKAIDTLVDVAFGNGTFVGVGLHSLRMTTRDGKTWENRQVGLEGEHLNSIVWADSKFVAIGQGATYFSPDGINWERKDNQNAPLAATYSEGQYVGVHWKGRILHSTDALQWKEVYKSEHHFEAVA